MSCSTCMCQANSAMIHLLLIAWLLMIINMYQFPTGTGTGGLQPRDPRGQCVVLRRAELNAGAMIMLSF